MTARRCAKLKEDNASLGRDGQTVSAVYSWNVGPQNPRASQPRPKVVRVIIGFLGFLSLIHYVEIDGDIKMIMRMLRWG